MTIAFTDTYSASYYEGAAYSSDVPNSFPIAIAGHPYMVDTVFAPFRRAFARKSLAPQRAARDYSNIPGIESVNTEGLWRRLQESWHMGAGQVYYDRAKSDPNRFRSSKGINPWELWQLSLLPDTTNQRATSNTNIQVLTVGSYLYLIDGSGLYFTNSLSGTVTWTAVTGLPAVAPSSMCTDGNTIYTAHGADGIYSTTAGAASAASFNSLACTLVGYAADRLMAANGASLYNVTASGAAPAALFTQQNADWVWTHFTEGTSQIYACGYSGSHSRVYRIDIVTDGSTLAAPVSAVALPSGEVANSVYGYAGFVLIGTSLGVRFADYASKTDPTANAGDLILGSLLPYNPDFIPQLVQCFAGQNSFVWFGWTDYDGVSTGLGRVNLAEFIDPLTPAYASDIMATAQGPVTSIAFLGGLIAFTVQGVGVFVQSPNKVASGTLESGFITFGIPDSKTGMSLEVRHESPLAGSHSAAVALDGGAFVSVGSYSAAQPNGVINLPFMQAVDFEIQHTLSSDGAAGTPVLTHQIFKALPAVAAGTTFSPVIVLRSEVEDLNGVMHSVDVPGEIAYLESLRQSQEIVAYQEGTESFAVVIFAIDYQPEIFARNRKSYQSVAMVTLKSLEG